jgi:hypothetical protein
MEVILPVYKIQNENSAFIAKMGENTVGLFYDANYIWIFGGRFWLFENDFLLLLKYF